MPTPIFAVSINDPDERYSAAAGDYWQLADHEPLLDSGGDAMVLAYERTVFIDPFSGEQL